MAYLGPILYSVNGGSEIDILKRHHIENWDRLVVALAYARNRLPLYSPAELKELRDALRIMKWDYSYINACNLKGQVDGNPGLIASDLLYDISMSEAKR